MSKISLEELKIDIEKINDILIDVRRLAFESHKLIETKTSAEFTYVHRSNFIKNIYVAYWKLAVIELYKLLSKSNNDDFRIECLLNKLINNYRHSEWSDKILLNDLKRFQSKIAYSNIQVVLEKLYSLEIKNMHIQIKKN